MRRRGFSLFGRTKTPAERFRAASQSAEVVREMIAVELRERNPDWSEMRVRHVLGSIWLSDALKDEVLLASDVLAGKPEIRERVMAAVFGTHKLTVCADQL
jgi:hypothetical protein